MEWNQPYPLENKPSAHGCRLRSWTIPATASSRRRRRRLTRCWQFFTPLLSLLSAGFRGANEEQINEETPIAIARPRKGTTINMINMLGNILAAGWPRTNTGFRRKAGTLDRNRVLQLFHAWPKRSTSCRWLHPLGPVIAFKSPSHQ